MVAARDRSRAPDEVSTVNYSTAAIQGLPRGDHGERRALAYNRCLGSGSWGTGWDKAKRFSCIFIQKVKNFSV